MYAVRRRRGNPFSVTNSALNMKKKIYIYIFFIFSRKCSRKTAKDKVKVHYDIS